MATAETASTTSVASGVHDSADRRPAPGHANASTSVTPSRAAYPASLGDEQDRDGRRRARPRRSPSARRSTPGRGGPATRPAGPGGVRGAARGRARARAASSSGTGAIVHHPPANGGSTSRLAPSGTGASRPTERPSSRKVATARDPRELRGARRRPRRRPRPRCRHRVLERLAVDPGRRPGRSPVAHRHRRVRLLDRHVRGLVGVRSVRPVRPCAARVHSGPSRSRLIVDAIRSAGDQSRLSCMRWPDCCCSPTRSPRAPRSCLPSGCSATRCASCPPRPPPSSTRPTATSCSSMRAASWRAPARCAGCCAPPGSAPPCWPSSPRAASLVSRPSGASTTCCSTRPGPAEVDARLRLAMTKGQDDDADLDLPITSGELVIDEASYSARFRGQPARPDLQGVRAAQVPRAAPGPGLHPRPAAPGGLGLRLLRRHAHRRRARAAPARQARPRPRGPHRHGPQRRLPPRARPRASPGRA